MQERTDKMNKPVIAVVGRPNVGKSTLFNKLIGQRLSIVDDTPGVTRDRIYGEVEWCGKTAFIVDTGGIEPKSDDIILVQMRRQAQLAIDTANVIILVTDCKSGMVATDMDVAQMLQKSGKPVVLCVNKIRLLKISTESLTLPIPQDFAVRAKSMIISKNTVLSVQKWLLNAVMCALL